MHDFTNYILKGFCITTEIKLYHKMQWYCILCILTYLNTRVTQRGYIATIMEGSEFPSEVTYMYVQFMHWHQDARFLGNHKDNMVRCLRYSVQLITLSYSKQEVVIIYSKTNSLGINGQNNDIDTDYVMFYIIKNQIYFYIKCILRNLRTHLSLYHTPSKDAF